MSKSKALVESPSPSETDRHPLSAHLCSPSAIENLPLCQRHLHRHRQPPIQRRNREEAGGAEAGREGGRCAGRRHQRVVGLQVLLQDPGVDRHPRSVSMILA
eukprot:254907-Rhodomonas_salina.2